VAIFDHLSALVLLTMEEQPPVRFPPGECKVLAVTPTARQLTRRILETGLIPQCADADAAHIGLAAAHSMDFLLTWTACSTRCSGFEWKGRRGWIARSGFTGRWCHRHLKGKLSDGS
jgi:hypothetical protein